MSEFGPDRSLEDLFPLPMKPSEPVVRTTEDVLARMESVLIEASPEDIGRLNPPIAQLIVARELRHARTIAGITLQGVAEVTEWSPSKISRIEAAVFKISRTDLTFLTEMYNLGPEEEERLQNLNTVSRRERLWWNKLKEDNPNIPPNYWGYFARMLAATVIIKTSTKVVPDVLQSVASAPEDAKRLGIDLDRLSFDRPFGSANGIGYGAKAVVASLGVGPIQFSDVEVSINKSAMGTSLLGMAFLKRLKSYSVSGGKLILRW